jgi:hypothetical protein
MLGSGTVSFRKPHVCRVQGVASYLPTLTIVGVSCRIYDFGRQSERSHALRRPWDYSYDRSPQSLERGVGYLMSVARLLQ